MSRLLITILFNSFVFFFLSQDNHKDSLLIDFHNIKDTSDKISFCIDQGDAHSYSNLDEFCFWYKKAIELAEKTKDKSIIAMLYSYMSYETSANGDMITTAEHIHNGKKHLNDSTPDKYSMRLYNAEADYFNRVEKFDKAIKIYKKLIAKSIEINDTLFLSTSLHNIGISYYKKEDYKSADSLIKEAYRLNSILNYGPFINNNLSMLANISSKNKKYKKALEYNLIAKNRFDSINDLSGMTIVRINMAGSYWVLNKKELAYKSVNDGLKMAKDNKLKRWEWNANKVLSDFYIEDKKYRKALDAYIQYSDLKSSSINQESSTKLESLESELNKKKMEVLEKDKALQQEQIKFQQEQINSEMIKNEKETHFIYFLLFILVLALAFGFFIYNRLKLSNKQKIIIEKQKQKTQLAYEEIEEKNSNINASINYAQRIQNAILPTEKMLSENLKNHFILFKPKDVVSGDFYWNEKANGFTFIAVADCTGHGVPGAIVSVICHNALNRCIKEFKLTSPGEILDKARDLVIQQFEKSDQDVKDGMDISICSINNKTNKLTFAGANNPLWLIRKGKLMVTKGDKQPIGKHQKSTPFTTHSIETESNDIIYLFSDGYVDQFGGVKGKKFMYSPFKKLLLSIYEQPMQEQKQIILERLESWKKDLEQVDDVCVLGMKI